MTGTKSQKICFIFNGPPGSGKDFIASYLADKYNGVHLEFKNRLFAITQAIYNISDKKLEWYYQRENKEVKFPELGNKSIRECLIEVSEKVIKPYYGKYFFGEAAKRSVDSSDNEFFFFSDGGFVEEMAPFFKDDHIHTFIVHLHANGKTFKGDSRNYVYANHLAQYVDKDKAFSSIYAIHNNFDYTFVDRAIDLVEHVKQLGYTDANLRL